MPRRAQFKTRRRKRRRPRGRIIGKLARTLAPKKTNIHLRYCQQIELAALAGGALRTHFFSANGMFDPDTTGAGHQPLGFDQYMALYNHYTVTRSKMSCHFHNGTTQPMVFGIHLNDDNTTSIVIPPDMTEQPDTVWGFTVPGATGEAGGNQGLTLTKGFSAKQNLGVSNPLSEINIRGNAASNPTEQANYILFSGPQNAASDTGAILCYVTIDFWATLTEPKELASS